MASTETTSKSIRGSLKAPLPPGARVEIRSEEWLVRSCQFDHDLDSYIVKAEGASGIVRGMQMTFLDVLDQIKIVNPLQIDFQIDDSPNFRKTKLFIDLWIKKSVPTTSNLVIGHRGVFNNEPYQREPAAKALDQEKHLRPRILMADAVGLGKTIQVGILLSELIRRGKGQRILVVCLRSMMTQLQKELWSRFSIPLKMMDSQKVERVFSEIPSRMNPFNYYDQMIMSMDTLKTKTMMGYLDTARWDVIVIDECHNVARRGKSSSDRSKLAKKLSAASDALILTSATPHDGTKESYSSLLELLDPTLVTDPSKITKEDLQNAEVVFRRFGKDLDLQKKIPERIENPRYVDCSKLEEDTLLKLKGKVFKVLDNTKTRKKDVFFRSTLSKALFSSPDAVISSIDERLKKLKSDSNSGHKEDLDFLSEIRNSLSKFSIKDTPKYRELSKLLSGKSGISKKDRIVIFTESRKTQAALVEALASDLELEKQRDEKVFDSKAQIITFNASVPEDEQQLIIESFASENSKIKILVTTDIASEGVNLHFFCHNLIHYDVPWSLITLEQRNGRIHRYGQTHESNIFYLINDTKIPELAKFRERWVVDKLLVRAKEVREHLGDESLALGCCDPEAELEKIAIKFQDEEDVSSLFDASLLVDQLAGTITPTSKGDAVVVETRTLFNDQEFVIAAAKELEIKHKLEGSTLELPLSENAKHKDALMYSLRLLERELEIEDQSTLLFSSSISEIEEAIGAARKKTGLWCDKHLLWENHPTVKLLMRQLEGAFSKDFAPVVVLESSPSLKSLSFLVYGAIFNKKGQPITSELLYAQKQKGKWVLEEPFLAIKDIGFDKSKVVNSTSDKSEAKLKKLNREFLSETESLLQQYERDLCTKAIKESNERTPKLKSFSSSLDLWFNQKKEFLNATFKSANQKRRLQEEMLEAEKVHTRFQEYIRSQFEVEIKSPYIRIVAAFVPDTGGWT
jgi:ERCC4-related helicase